LLPLAPTDTQSELLRRFVEATRRAQIVTVVHRAQTEDELGELVCAELCETFEAEVAFVLARWNDERPVVVGSYGLRPDETKRLLEYHLSEPLETERCADDVALRSLRARALACAPFGDRTLRGVVGIARLYEHGFDDAEEALLQAIAGSIGYALERLRLAEERDRLYREAEERGNAARVIGSIADGVLLVDGAGIVRLWNPAAEAITGLVCEAVVGRQLDEAIPGWAAIAASVVVANDPSSTGGHATAVPLEILGRELWLSIRGVDFAEGTVYAFRDLTEARRLEQLKADFIATVSHELRTPLAAVHGAAMTLQRPDIVAGDEVFDRLLKVIAEQSARLAEMVNNILLASRVDSTDMQVATDRVDVVALAAEVLAAVRAVAGERMTIDLIAPPDLPPLAGDREKLRQILTNLVANAAKYSPAGSRIEVELLPREAELQIVVRDEGLGIAPEEQSLIFEKFYRADANMTRGVSGSGLGLYISRGLVNLMGGAISVQSELGKGSTFVVTLPLVAHASPA
jgi:two-component system, OmpR family, phosphate regulon sensor histidine kinase PhoR